MKDPQIREWLEKRFSEVSEALNEHNEEDQIEAMLFAKETLDRCLISIEARMSIWSRPYPARYVAPWKRHIAEKPEGGKG